MAGNLSNHHRALIERAILELLSRRDAAATLCPSEVARAVFGPDWRQAMEATREVVREMVARGLIEITQRGAVVDPASARGAIRIRRKAPDGGVT